MLFDEFPLVALGLIVVTYVGLTIARIRRENRDAALSELPGAWRFRAQLPIGLGDPFIRFRQLVLAGVTDVMEGADEGFEVSYFVFWRDSEHGGFPVPAAIVQLPVEGPALAMSEGQPVPSHVGPQTAEVLKYLTAMDVTVVPFALLARATHAHAPALILQRTALQLAKAIVADAKAASTSEAP